MASRARLLAHTFRLRARSRRDLPRCLPRGRAPVPASPWRARSPSGPRLHPRRRLPGIADALPSHRLFGSQAPRRRLGRSRALGPRDHGLVRWWRLPSAVRVDAGLCAALGPLSLDREHRPDLLLLRLGVALARNGLPHHLPWTGHDGTAVQPDRPHALAALPGRVRRWAHQDARRPLLARPDLPLLPPRNAADAESAELVLPSSAEASSSDGGAGQPLRAARGPVVPLLPAAHRD